MTNSLSNNHVLIVGASSGIGFLLAERLSAYMQVSAIARRKNKLEKLENFGVKSYIVDVCDNNIFRQEVNNIVSERGKFTHAIFCAGKQLIKPLRSINDEDINNIFSVNLIAPLVFASLFSSKKISTQKAVLCFVSSISSFRPEPGIIPYSMSKAAIDALIKGMARELAPKRVVGIAPGWLSTEMTQNIPHIYDEQFVCQLEEKSPLGITKVSSIVDGIEFLVSDKASNITGQIITVDSGSSLL